MRFDCRPNIRANWPICTPLEAVARSAPRRSGRASFAGCMWQIVWWPQHATVSRVSLDRLAALLLVQRGDTVRARTIADRLVLAAESGDPFRGMYTSPDEPLIELLVAVGDRESAFTRMDSLVAFKGHVRRLASDPLLDPLRSDPRMDALLAQMALICRGSGERRVCQPIE